jgi:hypothetical protein
MMLLSDLRSRDAWFDPRPLLYQYGTTLNKCLFRAYSLFLLQINAFLELTNSPTLKKCRLRAYCIYVCYSFELFSSKEKAGNVGLTNFLKNYSLMADYCILCKIQRKALKPLINCPSVRNEVYVNILLQRFPHIIARTQESPQKPDNPLNVQQYIFLTLPRNEMFCPISRHSY